MNSPALAGTQQSVGHPEQVAATDLPYELPVLDDGQAPEDPLEDSPSESFAVSVAAAHPHVSEASASWTAAAGSRDRDMVMVCQT